jgi:hypothetical protein
MTSVRRRFVAEPRFRVVAVVILYVAISNPGIEPLIVLAKGGSGEYTPDKRVGIGVLARYSEYGGPRFRVEEIQVTDGCAERYAKFGAAIEYWDEQPGRGLLLFLCRLPSAPAARSRLRLRRRATQHPRSPRCGSNDMQCDRTALRQRDGVGVIKASDTDRPRTWRMHKCGRDV